MYCLKCGNELKDGDLFCTKCGEKVTPVQVAPVQEPEEVAYPSEENVNASEKKGSPLIIVISIIVIVAAVLYILYAVGVIPELISKVQERSSGAEEVEVIQEISEEELAETEEVEQGEDEGETAESVEDAESAENEETEDAEEESDESVASLFTPEKIVTAYVKNYADAITYSDFSYIEGYLVTDGPMYESMKEYVTKSVSEDFVSCEVVSVEYEGDNLCYVTTEETYYVQVSGGDLNLMTQKCKYQLNNVDNRWRIYDFADEIEVISRTTI